MNFNEELKIRTAEVQKIIESWLPEAEGFQKTVLEAMNYSMLAGGKRLRPMLMQETYHLFGGEGRIIEPFMAAMEMIHTYSLVHDDLPALDGDEYRRGRKTTWVVYGETMGILAGDGLLNYAYETACEAFKMEPGNPYIGQALSVLARKSGVYGMLGGQCTDVEAVGKTLSREKLDFIYRLKTSALIEAAMMTGAILAGAAKEDVEAVERIATDVGLAFQIQDDILDVTSTTEELGKPVLSDEKNEKTTYVTLEGMEKAKAEVERISQNAIDTLDSLKAENEFLRELIIHLINRKK
ncbi:MAG: polyprenyl synthetase family protein [Blautia sp.]|nr:polyprenyl synthetase family protein [Blautia sp.]MDY4515517.1 farnesyl diphosphate synthase [Lachnospiraceae bacterium]